MALASILDWRSQVSVRIPSAPRPLILVDGNTLAHDFLPKRAAPTPQQGKVYSALHLTAATDSVLEDGTPLNCFRQPTFVPTRRAPVPKHVSVAPIPSPFDTSSKELISHAGLIPSRPEPQPQTTHRSTRCHNESSATALRFAANEIQALSTLTLNCRTQVCDVACELSELYGTFQSLWLRSLSIVVPPDDSSYRGEVLLGMSTSPGDFDSDSARPLNHTTVFHRKQTLDAELNHLKMLLSERMRREAINMKAELNGRVTPITMPARSVSPPPIADSPPSEYSKPSMLGSYLSNKPYETLDSVSFKHQPPTEDSAPSVDDSLRRPGSTRVRRKRPPTIDIPPRCRSIAGPVRDEHHPTSRL